MIEQKGRTPAGIKSPAFVAFLITQFLGAVNDNTFRWIVVPIAKEKVGEAFDEWALGAGLACFVVPFIVLAPYAGYLSDRFSKRTVIFGCKIAELIIMTAGVAVIGWGNVYVLFIVVAFMGSQSAIFGPSKMGIIPELVDKDEISKANGIIGLTTVIAVVLGTIAGNWIYKLTAPAGTQSLWISAVALIGTAVAGAIAGFRIPKLRAMNPEREFRANPVTDTWRGLKVLAEDRAILRVAIGIAFFWSVASLAQLNVDAYAIDHLELTQEKVGPLLGVLSLGVGIGSVLAGIWSAGKVEVGIVPLGAALIAFSSILLVTTTGSSIWTGAFLFLLGTGGGLFNVPLSSYLQRYGRKESLGTILAASNFLTFSGMLLVSIVFPVLLSKFHFTAARVFFVTGLLTIPVAIYVFLIIPQASIRFLVWLASRLIYRVRVRGLENIPEEGGALLVANHVSWLDGAFLLITSSRPVRMVAYSDYVRGPVIGWLTRTFGVIPIKPEEGPKSILRSLQRARAAVESGELVCIFAEGSITRTGEMQPFQRGLMHIVKGGKSPVIPVYLHQLWGSIFSYSEGKAFWKLPRKWPYPVTILFGEPIQAPEDVADVESAVHQLEAEAIELTEDSAAD